MKTFKELMKTDVEATRMPMEAPFVLVDGVTGPTRMQIQKHFDKEKGLLRARIIATEKAFKISNMKVDAKGTVQSFKEEVEIDEEIFYWYIIKGDLANGKIVYAGNEKQVKLKRHDSRFGDGHVMTKSRKMKKVGEKWKKSEGVSEEVELGEKKSATGYELYHKTFSGAMQHAYAHAKSKGFVVDKKEIDDKVATGPKKPSSGKTNRYSLKAGRKKVEIQVANLDNKRYELNMYIEEVELDEMKWAVGGVYHQEFKNGDKTYFRADSVQKNKRWKGVAVDEFGGRQKKAKNASADEKQQGWETTPKNEIPKGLKEEVETRNGPPQIRFMWKGDKRITESNKAKSLAALRTALAVAKYKKAGGKIEKQPPGIARGALKFRGKGGTTRDDDEENRINRGVMSWKKLRHGKKKK